MKTEKKLTLQELSLNSFVTNLNSQKSKTVKGGDGVTLDHVCIEVSVEVSVHVSAHATEKTSATRATSGAISAVTSLISVLEAGPDLYKIASAIEKQSIDGVIGMACTRMINAGACDVAM